MVKRHKGEPKKQTQVYLVFCEGQTERKYLDFCLDKKKYSVRIEKYSNAEQLVNAAVKRMDSHGREWKAAYYVFDHDSHSNTKEQLQSVNKIIKDSNGSLIRVFSSPCFEVALWFSKSTNTKKFIARELEEAIGNHIGIPYSKSDMANGKLAKYFDFNQMCKNSKLCYEKLGVNDNNWLDDNLDSYSEIFKLS
jgi:hypothetical protein